MARRFAWVAGVGLLWLASAAPLVGSEAVDGAVVERSTVQSIPHDVVTAVSFTTETADDGGYWAVGSASILTIPRTAWCWSSATTIWEVNTTGVRWLELQVNGSGWIGRVAAEPSVGLSEATLTVSAGWYAMTGDVLRVNVHQNSGQARDLTAARASVTCDLLSVWPGGGGPVTVETFAGQALDYVQLAIFAVVVVGGFLLLVLAWIAVQGLRR